MRLLIIPLILAALLIQTPTTAFGNSNQQAAERIADAIGKHFPDADIEVEFRGGRVWLKGEAASQNQRQRIVERIFEIPGVNVIEVNDEIQVVAPRVPARAPAQAAQPVTAAVSAPVPVPNAPQPQTAAANNDIARQVPQARVQQQQQIQAQPQPQMAGSHIAPAPQQHHPAMYGMNPGQQPMVPPPFTQTAYVQHPQAQQMHQQMPPIPQHHHPAYYGQPAHAAHHPEAYGPQGPLPGQYNQPHLPDYAWPAYANYPNYAQVSYPRNYSPKAWPYIGPFYPYPQVPMGWRKVTLEHNNGWWWLDFDDGTPSGPFSGLFRQPQRYTY